MKIIDKIKDYQKKKTPFIAFEYFPPKTETGLHNLYERLDRMAISEPAYIDVTWGAGGSTSDLTLEISRNIQNYFGLDVLMHLTCTNMPKSEVVKALDSCLHAGIHNILALRGDPPSGNKKWEGCDNGFQHASELVEFIKEKYGDQFCIAVAGYPEGHLEDSCPEDNYTYLKHKVERGADLIVTQLFYDCESFLRFRDKCKDLGINCPIIPGILPIQTYDRFKRFTDFLQVHIPDKLQNELYQIKEDDEKVKEYGIEYCVQMCQDLLNAGCDGLHFYTLNLEGSVLEILKRLNLSQDSRSRRELPWRPTTQEGRRQQEDVRPAFWSNRPKSYLARTKNWDDFPNGRWGNSKSPSFGQLEDYYLLRQGIGLQNSAAKRLKQWGRPTTSKEVAQVFLKFCKGEIDRLPWCEIAIQKETTDILPEIVWLNQHGFLTINSQPQINGLPSEDKKVGWGRPNGFVYQKAYIECFLPKDLLLKVTEFANHSRSLTYMAANSAGDLIHNLESNSPNAVTWGVFPGKEIIQPTVVDLESFRFWKDEAFALWLQDWASIYPKESLSFQTIKDIHNNYYLLNLVENDFQNGNIFRAFQNNF